MKALWTPSEANKTLPLVKRIVADILERGAELRALVHEGRGETAQRRSEELEDQLRDLMRELEQIGCLYKDWGFEAGLVDFPARIDGEKVFLCWRSDEESVTWYHPVEAGFQGRQPIPAEMLT
jgi:hypothetical protein